MMKHSFQKSALAAILLLSLGMAAAAQGQATTQGVPREIYYLMPSFSQGVVYLRGQAPARGKLNICAVDQTLRFLDDAGNELEAERVEDIVKVRIDTVTFLRSQNAYYRMFPISEDMGIAVRRDVRILRDAKQGGYGIVSQTTSVMEYGAIYSDGAGYKLNSDKEYPYNVSEQIYIYREDAVFPFTRKGLRKCFPDRKDEIDAWFKEGHPLPATVAEAQVFLSRWR